MKYPIFFGVLLLVLINFPFCNLTQADASRSAKGISRAKVFVKQGRFSEARSEALRYKKDKIYSDYSLWLVGASNREEAKVLIKSGQVNQAITLLDRAKQSFLNIYSDQLYSPLRKTIPEEVGRVALISAHAWFQSGKWKRSQMDFEQAFHLLKSEESISFLSQLDLEHYAEACKKAPGVTCSVWMKTLKKFASSFSREAQILAKYPFSLPPQDKLASVAHYSSPSLDYSFINHGISLYFKHSYTESLSELQAALSRFPESSYTPRAKYWLAQALKKTNRIQEAEALLSQVKVQYPLSYYSILATTESNLPVSALNHEAPIGSNNSVEGFLPSDLFHLNRARSFLAERENEFATRELESIKSLDGLSNQELFGLARLALASDSLPLQIFFANKLIERRYPGFINQEMLKLLFPTSYLSTIKTTIKTTIKKYAVDLKWDPVLALSMMRQESSFSETNFSSVGAMGLMNLMPDTAFEMNPTLSRPDLWNSVINISLGLKYLDGQISSFQGNLALSVLGYWAGANTVKGWLEGFPKSVSLLEFIEAIPDSGSYDYLISVISSYFWYQRIFQGDSYKAEFSVFWKSI